MVDTLREARTFIQERKPDIHACRSGDCRRQQSSFYYYPDHFTRFDRFSSLIDQPWNQVTNTGSGCYRQGPTRRISRIFGIVSVLALGASVALNLSLFLIIPFVIAAFVMGWKISNIRLYQKITSNDVIVFVGMKDRLTGNVVTAVEDYVKELEKLALAARRAGPDSNLPAYYEQAKTEAETFFRQIASVLDTIWLDGNTYNESIANVLRGFISECNRRKKALAELRDTSTYLKVQIAVKPKSESSLGTMQSELNDRSSALLELEAATSSTTDKKQPETNERFNNSLAEAIHKAYSQTSEA